MDENILHQINDAMRKASDEMARKFRTCLRGPGRFIGIDDLCGTLITRDPLPPGAVFEGTVIVIGEPVESLMDGGALEVVIRKRKTNTLTVYPGENDGPQKKD